MLHSRFQYFDKWGSAELIELSSQKKRLDRDLNYDAWLSDPTHIRPSAQVVWPIVGQEILNGDLGGGFRGIHITSGFFQIWRASGITSELQLYCTVIGGLVFAALILFASLFHYHKAAPKLAWFQDVESMLNDHLAGLLGLGSLSLSWVGHQVHVSLPVNQFLNVGVDPKEIPFPHEFILNRDLLVQLYPSFAEGATPFFTLNWSKYADNLTFRGGLDPVTGGLWLTDTGRSTRNNLAECPEIIYVNHVVVDPFPYDP
ncbi:unnamed protein product [Lactuca virosa]|uniref:Photosystem I chlorophyll a apoprotein A1 n=1 Tax=Lactuca virosa TaxID=75947 RepID=A0AAU9MLR8_9ASTR|nr:unnamed protein product [Lactuca virosa]